MTITSPAVSIPPRPLRNRLRDAREFRNLDQIDIARELGISRATVSNYERGISKPGKLVINAWAVVTNVDVEWLKTGHEGQPSDYKGQVVNLADRRAGTRPPNRNRYNTHPGSLPKVG